MKKFMGKILGIFSDDLGIDLGTSNTLICMKNKGIILREPSVVAISTKTKEIFEVGEKAKHMIGRTPSTYETIRPLRNGVIADYEVTEKMLRCFYKRIKSGTFLNKIGYESFYGYVKFPVYEIPRSKGILGCFLRDKSGYITRIE